MKADFVGADMLFVALEVGSEPKFRAVLVGVLIEDRAECAMINCEYMCKIVRVIAAQIE